MLKLPFKDLFSTYKKTLWCDNCQKEFRQVLRKGHRIALDAKLSVVHVVVDAWKETDIAKIYKGVVACPKCGCSSQISVKEVPDAPEPR